jgi:hypothetical protein
MGVLYLTKQVAAKHKDSVTRQRLAPVVVVGGCCTPRPRCGMPLRPAVHSWALHACMQ